MEIYHVRADLFCKSMLGILLLFPVLIIIIIIIISIIPVFPLNFVQRREAKEKTLLEEG